MNMSIPDFLINDSYDHSLYDNTYRNEQLNSINVLAGKNLKKKKQAWSPEKKRRLWLWLLLGWLALLGTVLGVLLWFYLAGPGSASPENCPLSICRYGALSCDTTVTSALCTCREPAWIKGTETDPFSFSCSRKSFTNCQQTDTVNACETIDVSSF